MLLKKFLGLVVLCGSIPLSVAHAAEGPAAAPTLSRILECQADAQALEKMIRAYRPDLTSEEMAAILAQFPEILVDERAPQNIEVYDQAINSDGNGMMAVEYTNRPADSPQWPSSKSLIPATVSHLDGDINLTVEAKAGKSVLTVSLPDYRKPGLAVLTFQPHDEAMERQSIYSCSFTPVY